MDGRRIDGLARLVAGAKTRRRRFAVLAAGVLAVARHEVVASPAGCQPENAWCTMWLRCCEGFVCTLSRTSANLGTCLLGEDTLGTGFVFSDADVSRASMTAAQATATSTPTGGGKKQRKRDKRDRKQDRRADRRSNNARPTSTPRPTPTPSPTPTPIPGDDLGVEIKLFCGRFPERMTVKNSGRRRFALKQVYPVGIKSGESLAFCFPADNGAYSLGKNAEVTYPEGQGLMFDDGDVLEAGPDSNDGVILTVEYQLSEAPFAPQLHQFRGYCDGRQARSLGPVKKIEPECKSST
jgi:hypothetical protein